ncbi:unnamed protein product [Caenorhabditis angaria]|uniref:Lysosomal acid phosphatase n=1 Tax=Caenorhabditis angaria TaxID=860376 RepID=A0A9P1IQF7_9PELO|nr:unnamed protein product [Caenorhabditis angaria]
MRQLHELGEFFRAKYVASNFLPANFSTKTVYLQSSDSDRALTSAQAFLYGFYPARNAEWRWEADLDWQPIPVHAATPGEPDLTCKATSIKCPKHALLAQDSENRAKTFYDQKYADFFREISGQNRTGLDNCSYSDINGLYDIQRELIHGLLGRQPDWVHKKWAEFGGRTSMDLIFEMRTRKMLDLFNSDEKSRLMGGSILNIWLENARNVAEGKMDRKMMLYSSHDGVLLALLNALGASNNQMVPYAATLIMEIYSTPKNGHVAQFYYRNSSDLAPVQIFLPKCPEPCEISQLYSNFQNMTVKNLQELQELCSSGTRGILSIFLWIFVIFWK